MKIHNFLHRQC